MSTTKAKQDADYIFYELTRSVCPKCLDPIDAQILIKDGRVIMRKRCRTHGWFESLVRLGRRDVPGLPAIQQARDNAPRL